MLQNVTNNTEKEFSDEQVGEWILYKVYNDISVLDIFASINNDNWYADENISLLIKLVIMYYKRHGTNPTEDAIIGNIKYLKSVNKLRTDDSYLIQVFRKIVNTPINIPDDTINNAIEIFVKDSGLYHAFNDLANSRLGIGKGVKKVTVEKTLADVHKFEDFTLDNDIGLDYFSQEGMNEHWEFLTNPVAKMPTGINWFDKVTSGGIYRDGHFLGVIAAAPNVGKSIILGNLAYQALMQDMTVLIISLEMSEQVYARRITSLIADSCIDTLGDYSDEAKKNIEQFKEEHPNSRLIIKEYPTGGATPMNIDAYLESLIRHGIKPDVVMLDYLNLLKPSRHTNNEKQHIQVGYITKEIRGISTKFKIPFWSATQSNRAGYDNTEVELSNISQSTAVAEDADLIFSAYRFDEDVIQGIIKMKIIKSRLGGKGYPPHMFQLDADTLNLIDKGDVVMDGTDSNIDLSDVINNVGKKATKSEKKDVEHPTTFAKPIVENSTISENISSISSDIDAEFIISDIF